ncbi:Acetyltransferase (GNAT) family protein [Faunimonas pinastri]|uniref:Acetyltransferase (GNAT) family protein n=1 Tax=Faunimonas pinastri TaxID=1855383 RepID=A0A1H9FMX1_9HYPH|nr:GNAT family N-acetyltransferase [Faunimonas pinastri]SEQ38803.1 Acetyltransferase (GNAT) family protein [Faunimonas pinastri]
MPESWRLMLPDDMAAVEAVAAVVHPGFFERTEVLTERLALYPEGCRVLERSGVVVGYLISHPWDDGAVPALDTFLHRLPEVPGTCYLHDIALLPEARRGGAGSQAVIELIDRAGRRFPSLSLVAVHGSAPFWERHGLRIEDRPELRAKLASYDENARYMRRIF